MPSATLVEALPPQTSEPVLNRISRLERLMFLLGYITKPGVSRTGGAPIQRPLFLRAARAMLLKLMKSATRAQRPSLLEEARLRDAVAHQYLAQGLLHVCLDGWGEQLARYVRLDPVAGGQGSEALPPIFFVPGISNDLDCVGALLQEFPLQGRTVITVAQPESYMGAVTAGFAAAVAQDPAYGPHAAFFREALLALCPAGETIELWGLSAGAAIVQQKLLDPSLQERTSRAVLICPASSTDLGGLELRLGIVLEFLLLFLDLAHLANWTLTAGRRDGSETSEQRQLKVRIYTCLRLRVRRALNIWPSVHTSGGRVLILSASRDYLTKSYKVFNRTPAALARLAACNPEVEVVDLPHGSHGTPLTHPACVIRLLLTEMHNNP